MAKKGVSAVSGNTSPVTGEKNTYSISSWYPETEISARNPSKVTWELYKKRGNGKFTSTNIKKVGSGDFTFGEAAAGHTYRLEAYRYNPEGGGLVITPKPAKIPKINKVELFYVDDTKGNVFSFMEKLRARANCVNMFGKELVFTLWEDDAKGAGHYASNQAIDAKKARIDKNGIAVAEFMLTTALMRKAARGEMDSQLEFYVTVEFYKTNKHVTNKVYVNNPYPQQSPPKTTSPQTPAKPKANNSPAAHKPASKKEEAGILETISQKWDELWDWAESKGTGTKEKAPAVQKPDGKSAAVVKKTEADKKATNKCPRCEVEITLEQIKAICVSKENKKGTEYTLIVDEKFIIAALPYLNKYRKKADINTCLTKAHFLAQISQETKFYDLQERFKYTNPERMRKLFYSYFKQFGALDNQQKEAKRLSDLSLNKKNWPEVANAIYGKTHPVGKNNIDNNDGWRYSGKGYKQKTWRDNYVKVQKTAKNIFGKEVLWVDNDNPYKLVNEQEDAILSALAFWKQNNISAVATEISDISVKNVTLLINPALAGLDERKRFFKKAVDTLEVEKCKPTGKINTVDEDGTVIVVSGTETRIEKDAFRPNEYSWVMYKTSVFHNLSLKTYYELDKDSQLPTPDYTTYLSRDTHQTSTSSGKILKHSSKRYGQYNEIPPGEYFLVPGISGQKYKIYVIDSESKSASAENGIAGPDGSRGGVALHQYSPRFSVGCFTFNSGKDTKPIQDFIDNVPDLPVGDKKPVRFIVEPRQVTEGDWNNAEYGTKKWKGI